MTQMTSRAALTTNPSAYFAENLSRRQFVGWSAALAASGVMNSAAFAQAAKTGGNLRIVAYANPSSLDPYTGRSGADQTFLFAIFDTLVSFDQNLKPVPGLADWKYADPKTMVLEIKPNILFHDGTSCDAVAVKANLDRAMTHQRSSVKTELTSVASVEVTGPLQLTLHLKIADGNLPFILTDRSGMMSSPKAVTELGPDYDRKPCGTGQFRFEQWADNDKVVLKRFDDYWRKGEVKLEGVTFRIMTDLSAGVRAIGAGENDFMWVVPPILRVALERNKDVSVVKYASTRTTILQFNNARGPLKELKVRQAVNCAIDRVAFARVTTDGTGEAACGLCPPEHWAYDKESEKYYQYDPARAKALLAEAGYNDGCEIDFIYFADSEYKKRADIIMAMMEKAGFKLKTQTGAIAQAAQWMTDGKGDILLTVWPGRADLTTNYANLLAKDAFYNPGKVTPVANIEELLDATRTAADISQRTEAFHKMMRAEREGALLAPLCYEPVIYALRKNVKGFTPSLLGKPKLDGMYFDV